MFAGKGFANAFFAEADGIIQFVRSVGGTPSRVENPDRLNRRLEIMLKRGHADREAARRRQLEEDEALAALLAMGMI